MSLFSLLLVFFHHHKLIRLISWVKTYYKLCVSTCIYSYSVGIIYLVYDLVYKIKRATRDGVVVVSSPVGMK